MNTVAKLLINFEYGVFFMEKITLNMHFYSLSGKNDVIST